MTARKVVWSTVALGGIIGGTLIFQSACLTAVIHGTEIHRDWLILNALLTLVSLVGVCLLTGESAVYRKDFWERE